MKVEELEASIKALQGQIDTLQKQITTMQDVEEIKKLQRAYAYYLEHAMYKEVIDCFSDNTESIDTGVGLYLGKEGVKKHFSPGKPPEWLHIVMPLSAIIDVDPGGKTAKGRWYGLLYVTLRVATVPRALAGAGVYENEYIKEDGKWKFRKLQFCYVFQTPFGEEGGWVKTPFLPLDLQFELPEADKPDIFLNKQYPSQYVLPFHYKHPVTDD